MKMVTPNATGRHSNPRATGLDALRMKRRTSTNIRTDVAPDSTGDRNQDTTATQQVGSVVATSTAVLSEKLVFPQRLQSCHAFYMTRRFITAFTTDRHWSLS